MKVQLYWAELELGDPVEGEVPMSLAGQGMAAHHFVSTMLRVEDIDSLVAALNVKRGELVEHWREAMKS